MWVESQNDISFIIVIINPSFIIKEKKIFRILFFQFKIIIINPPPDEGPLSLATEVWVEPQNGVVAPYTPTLLAPLTKHMPLKHTPYLENLPFYRLPQAVSDNSD